MVAKYGFPGNKAAAALCIITPPRNSRPNNSPKANLAFLMSAQAKSMPSSSTRQGVALNSRSMGISCMRAPEEEAGKKLAAKVRDIQ